MKAAAEVAVVVESGVEVDDARDILRVAGDAPAHGAARVLPAARMRVPREAGAAALARARPERAHATGARLEPPPRRAVAHERVAPAEGASRGGSRLGGRLGGRRAAAVRVAVVPERGVPARIALLVRAERAVVVLEVRHSVDHAAPASLRDVARVSDGSRHRVAVQDGRRVELELHRRRPNARPRVLLFPRFRSSRFLRRLAPLQHHGAPRVRRVLFALRDARRRRLEPDHRPADAVLILQVIVQRQRRDIHLVPVVVPAAVPAEAVPGVTRARLRRLVVILQPHVGDVAGVRLAETVRSARRRARGPVPRARVEPRVHLVHDEVVVHVAVYAVVVRVLLLERRTRAREPARELRVQSDVLGGGGGGGGGRRGAARLEEQLEVVVVLGERDGVQRRGLGALREVHVLVPRERLLDLDERLGAVLEQVIHLAAVHAHHAQHELAGEPERERGVGVDDGLCRDGISRRGVKVRARRGNGVGDERPRGRARPRGRRIRRARGCRSEKKRRRWGTHERRWRRPSP